MGLYGALIVRPSAGANLAYDAATQFDPTREYLLLLAEVDPDLHHAVETGGAYDFNTLHNRYYFVNGRAFPDTLQDNGSAFLPAQPYGALVRIQPNSPTSDQPALIRMLNAGPGQPPLPPARQPPDPDRPGRPACSARRDGRASTERFGETIGSGQTQDYLLRWDDVGQLGSGHATRCRSRSRTYPEPRLQGRQHLVQRQPVPRLQGHAAHRHQLAERLRRVVLPLAQPRAERVRQLRRAASAAWRPCCGSIRTAAASPSPVATTITAGTLEQRLVCRAGSRRYELLQGQLDDDGHPHHRLVRPVQRRPRRSDQPQGDIRGEQHLCPVHAELQHPGFDRDDRHGAARRVGLLRESATGGNTSYGVSTGSSNTGNTYSFGSTGSTDTGLRRAPQQHRSTRPSAPPSPTPPAARSRASRSATPESSGGRA